MSTSGYYLYGFFFCVHAFVINVFVLLKINEWMSNLWNESIILNLQKKIFSFAFIVGEMKREFYRYLKFWVVLFLDENCGNCWTFFSFFFMLHNFRALVVVFMWSGFYWANGNVWSWFKVFYKKKCIENLIKWSANTHNNDFSHEFNKSESYTID